MRATELAEAALRIFRELGDKWGTARSLAEIGLHSCARAREQSQRKARRTFFSRPRIVQATKKHQREGAGLELGTRA
jgi:hypothetical protein